MELEQYKWYVNRKEGLYFMPLMPKTINGVFEAIKITRRGNYIGQIVLEETILEKAEVIKETSLRAIDDFIKKEALRRGLYLEGVFLRSKDAIFNAHNTSTKEEIFPLKFDESKAYFCAFYTLGQTHYLFGINDTKQFLPLFYRGVWREGPDLENLIKLLKETEITLT